MQKIQVKVQSDFLERISTSKPYLAIAELIWNALDAESSKVSVILSENELGAVEKITVRDNGHGISYTDAFAAFENLGGSWKKNSFQSKNGHRKLHGKKGQGRFLSLSLGQNVVWNTSFYLDSNLMQYEILGFQTSIGEFQISNLKKSVNSVPGTTVTISGITNPLTSLATQDTKNSLNEIFALYLRQYPTVEIIYDGIKLDPEDVQYRVEDKKLDSINLSDGSTADAHLTTIEWKIPIERNLHLCDSNGFSLTEIKPGIQAPGFNFTSYLKTDFFRNLDDKGGLIEINSDVAQFVDLAKTELRAYFRNRTAERAASVVEEWKVERIYPYDGTPRNIIEETERQVFEVCALSLNDYMPGFETLDARNKKLTFSLLKQAIEESPKAVQRIFDQILELPKEKQEEFAELLEKTSLTAIINASKVVADRINFLKGLEILLYKAESRKQLLERSQLHRILADETWIFGEEFNLTVDDQSLTEVLKKHLELLGRDSEDVDSVWREDNSKGVVDLMLSRRIPLPKPEHREHLVIELKRPSQSVDDKVVQQIKSYAFAVIADERFKNTETKWTFWAISNEMSDSAKREANQRNRPSGLIYEDEDEKIFIWVKTWSQVLEACRGRLEFFQKQLEYSADHDSGLQYLRKVHEKFLPKTLSEVIIETSVEN